MHEDCKALEEKQIASMIQGSYKNLKLATKILNEGIINIYLFVNALSLVTIEIFST